VTGVTAYYGMLAAVFHQFEEGGSMYIRIFVTIIEKQLNKQSCSNKTRNCDFNKSFVSNKNVKIVTCSL